MVRKERKMPRRGENIRKRKDGRWEGRYYVRELETGKNIQHSVYAKTYSEVREKLRAVKSDSKKIQRQKDGGLNIYFCQAAEVVYKYPQGKKARDLYKIPHDL